jgi:hypothetical protein
VWVDEQGLRLGWGQVLRRRGRQSPRDDKVGNIKNILTLSNPIFLPTAYSPALICFGRARDWWITCNYPTVKKNIENQKEYNLRYLLAKVRTT